jgi:hypothetical protein
VFYNKTTKKHEGLAIGRRKNTVKYSVSTPPETRKKEKTRATLRVFAMLSASQTKTQNIQTCFLAENTAQGSVFTPSDTNKTANQLAPVGLKGGRTDPNPTNPEYHTRIGAFRASRPTPKPTTPNNDNDSDNNDNSDTNNNNNNNNNTSPNTDNDSDKTNKPSGKKHPQHQQHQQHQQHRPQHRREQQQDQPLRVLMVSRVLRS